MNNRTGLFAAVVRLACFNPAGFAAIGNTPQAFLSSLAPLIAFLAVFSGLEIAIEGWRLGVTDFLQTLCIFLGQPVLSQLLARAAGREPAWLRYATAVNWCQFATPAVAALALLAGQLGQALLPAPRGLYLAIGLVLIYALALQFFLARRGLNLTVWRAIGFVLAINFALGAALSLPILARTASTKAHSVHVDT